ncbi:MAG: hypothetical protein ACO3JL_08960 [Myxococcota bacterium]
MQRPIVFHYLPGHSSLGVVPDQVVAVIESMNTPHVGSPVGTERTKAYVVGLRLPSGAFTVAIYLHLLDNNRSCIYASDPLEVPLEYFSSLEGEAIHFVESMGFMLENLNFRARPAEEIARLIQRLPFFYEVPPRTGTFAAVDLDSAGLPPDSSPPKTGSHTPRSGVSAKVVPPLSDPERADLARFLASF